MFWVSCSQLGTKLHVFVVFLLQVFAEEANRDLQSSLGPQIDGECRRVTYKMKNKNKRYKQCYTENERVFKNCQYDYTDRETKLKMTKRR